MAEVVDKVPCSSEVATEARRKWLAKEAATEDGMTRVALYETTRAEQILERVILAAVEVEDESLQTSAAGEVSM